MLVIVYICQSVSIFFFKQKTAYEMRISDWSSDVCSYDLWRPGVGCRRDLLSVSKYLIRTRTGRALTLAKVIRMVHNKSSQQALTHEPEAPSTHQHQHQHQHAPAVEQPAPRSEEHTSELQSLMRISYAVFCLENKNPVMSSK